MKWLLLLGLVGCGRIDTYDYVRSIDPNADCKVFDSTGAVCKVGEANWFCLRHQCWVLDHPVVVTHTP